MYQSNFGFPDLEAIEPDVNTFYQLYLAQSRLSEIEDDDEKKVILEQFQQYYDDINTPLYLLVIIKRILVDGVEEYGNILELISFLNNLIENKTEIVNFSKENQEYNEFLVSGMFFLLPYTASYFRSSGNITCFDNLLSSLIGIKSMYDDDSQQIFNTYVDSLLVDFEDNAQNIIALKFASKALSTDQVKEKILQYSIFLLNNLKSYDLNDESQYMLYDIFFRETQIKVSCFLSGRLLDPQIIFESINSYFDFYLTKFNPQERIFPEKIEIDLPEKVINFLTSTMKDYLNSHNLEYEERHEFCSVITRIVYEKSLNIVNSSQFYFSTLISRFLLNFLDYLDLGIIEQNKGYFCKLIQSLTVIRSTYEIMNSPQEILYIDYFDINFDSIQYLSNRQNVAQIIQIIVSKTHSINVLIYLCRFLGSIKPNYITECHFFILSVINSICEIESINHMHLLNPLAQLTLRFLNIGTEMISNSNMNYQKKNYFIFSNSFLINSNFYVLNFLNQFQSEQQQPIEGLPELIESESQLIRGWLDSLVSHVKNFSPDEEIDDNYYHIYFTFSCILLYKMIDNGMIQIEDEMLEFTRNYYNLCLTNDGIKLMSKIALETNNNEMMREIFDQFIDMSIEMAMKAKANEEEEEDQNENQNVDEENEKDKNKNEHILRFFSDNAAIISKMIESIDMNPEMFIISDENKLVSFGKVLLTENENEDWNFAPESRSFFSVVFSKAPNLNEWINFYFETPRDQFILGYGEWSIPISAVISNRPESIDQDLYNFIITVLKSYIEKTVETSDETRLINTIDFLYTNSLIIRLLELTLFPNIQMTPEDFVYLSDFVTKTLPSEDDCRTSDDYNREAHELGISIFKLAALLVKNDDSNEILNVFQELVNENKIFCEEMRYMIIFLIDNVLNENENEDLRDLREHCLVNDLVVDDSAKNTYENNDDLFLCCESHPIYKTQFYTIDNFVFD